MEAVYLKFCVFFTVLFLLLAGTTPWLQTESIEQVCHTACNGSMENSYLEKYCNLSGFHMTDRCCLNNSEVVGVDLHKCDLTEIPAPLRQITSLDVLLLHENPLRKTDAEDFRGLTHLLYLSLPAEASCPGGAQAWETVSRGASSVVCENETDPCVEEFVECPNNSSHCAHVAPGAFECQCDLGFHGYKCLLEGVFPMAEFYGVLAGVTVALSSLLFYIQGYKRITHKPALH